MMKNLGFTMALFVTFSVHSQNILNADFESHNSGIPDHWMLDSFGADIDLAGGTNGSSALRTWTWYSYVTGISVNGYKAYDFGGLLGLGTPYTLKPIALTGVYKYDTSSTMSTNDSAVVQVYLKKFNSTTSSVDTIMTGEIHLPATSGTDFSNFSVPITDLMPGTMPDSLVIVFRSAVGNGSCNGGDCLYLTVDDLAMEFSNGISDIGESMLSMYPNPANDIVNIEPDHEKVHIEVYDLTGKVCLQIDLGEGQNAFSTEFLRPGIYLVKTSQESGRIKTGRLIIQH